MWTENILKTKLFWNYKVRIISCAAWLKFVFQAKINGTKRRLFVVTFILVSVVSSCGTGTASASLRTVKSKGCTVGESAAYRLSLLSCFALFSGGRFNHTLLSSYSFHSIAFCVPLEGITWVNPCNVWWWKPVGNRSWELLSKQMV